MEYSRNGKNRDFGRKPPVYLYTGPNAAWRDTAPGGCSGKETWSKLNYCFTRRLLYHIRVLLLTFPWWPYSLPELLILKMGLRGFKSFSNHIEEGSLWVSWILETSLRPVMLWHLSWSSAQGLIKIYFPASSTHLPGRLACRILKVKHVSPPHS